MTNAELASIRARDAGHEYDDIDTAIRDRRELLAEVDALNEVVLALQQAVEREGADVDRLTAEVQRVRDEWAEDHFYQLGRSVGATYAERARISAVVEGLPPEHCPGCSFDGGASALIDRATLLSAIGGEE